jgi:hypothetical protein
MSAYALPGLFPPIPLDGKVNYSFDSYLIDVCTQKEEKVEYDAPVVGIVIEEAKIDALELVKALTEKKQAKVPRGRLRSRSTGSKCFRQSPSEQINQYHVKSSPVEVSMIFTLRVSLNGRTFNVVRNLARIRCLYNELIEEMEYYDNQTTYSNLDPVLCPTSERHVPAFPSIQEGVSTTSFGILNAQLKQYTPSLQNWFNDVFAIVSPNDSLCLSYFLCEPLLLPQPALSREYLTRGKSAPGRLECILEEEKGDDE